MSASIRDTVVNGIDGLNINIEVPFNVQDYIVGFKYAVGNLRRLPESIFARKDFETPGDGRLSVRADYQVEDNRARLATSWQSDVLGLEVGAIGDTKDLLTQVHVEKSALLAGNSLRAYGAYDLKGKFFAGTASYTVDKTAVTVSGDSASLDPVVSVTRPLDSQNDIMPSISLKTGKMAYAWRRRWAGGALVTRVHPNAEDKRVELEWSDVGTNGVWTTRAEFPLEDTSKVKISVSRDWVQ